jgi:hypothetical protein
LLESIDKNRTRESSNEFIERMDARFK